MEKIDYEEEQKIFSEGSKHQQKLTRFKEYLVSSQTIQHFVKFLFGLRSKQLHDEGVPSGDALQMFRDYFGALTPDTTQQDGLKEQISQIRAENTGLSGQIDQIRKEIEAKKLSIQKAKEQKRLRQQQQAKNPKKGGKK